MTVTILDTVIRDTLAEKVNVAEPHRRREQISDTGR